MKRIHPVFLLGCYAFVSIGINASLLGPALPTLSARTQASIEQVGFMFTAMSVGYLSSAPIIHFTSRHVSRQGMLIISPLIVIASLLLFALGQSLVVIFLAAYLLGLGHSGTQVTYITAVGTMFEGRQVSSSLNRLNAFFGLGALVGPVIASVSYASFNTADLAFWVAILAVLPLTIGALALTRTFKAGASSEPRANRNTQSDRSVLRSPVFWGMCAVMGIYVGSEVAFSSWATEFTRLTAGVDVATAALAVSAFFLGIGLSRYFTDVFVKRIAPVNFIIATVAVTVAGLGVMLLAGGYLGMLIGALLVGLGCGPVYPTLVAIGINRFRNSAQLVSSVLTSTGSIGAFFLPALTGFVIGGAAAGAVNAWLLLAVMFTSIIVMWLFLRPSLISDDLTEAKPEPPPSLPHFDG
jgi:fucose permease